MYLSLGSISAFNNSVTASDRSQRGLEPAHAVQTPPAGAEEEDSTAIPATRDSATRRPAMETRQASRLTDEELSQLKQLQQRDREVKAHELAHKAAGGRYVTGGGFTYQQGPDGRRYAIGGEVTIDASLSGSPRDKMQKADTIRRAALAPANPSSQDQRVASQAAMAAAEARSEIGAEQRQEQLQRREAMRERNSEEAEQGAEISPQAQRAIASFEAIGLDTSLQSSPDPIDEII
ncbi:MAG: hypothetical protein KZQ76_10500 [Candidatus Thiodiazotropha sp. (ex Epidulcina cf. delphinae)]|nr:hypothetical protein [Candidatus Thiodiazotropha sp. (ex Epidulcina cf. delphinae)]